MPERTCTCPSGDGSLRWPCPVHPPRHTCIHLFVAQRGQNLYYACRCGSRRHGIANNVKRHTSVDQRWLAGEKDQPT